MSITQLHKKRRKLYQRGGRQDKSEDMRQGNKHWVTYSSLDQRREELCFEKAAFMTVMSSERDSLAKLTEQS